MTVAAQVFALATTLPSAILLISLVRRGHLRVKYVLLWVPVIIAMWAFILIPGLLDETAQAVGVAYPPTMLFVLALGLLVFVCVHLSWEMSRLDERVRALAERLAIQSSEQRH